MNTVFQQCGGKNKIYNIFRVWQIISRDKQCIAVSKVYDVKAICIFDSLVPNVNFSYRNWIDPKRFELQDSPFVLQGYRFIYSSKNRCWKCNAVVTERDLVCMSCGCVQEPKPNLNNFEVFKESPHFDIDVRNLTVKFRRLQSMLHPDKFATRSEKEQTYSAEQSALVNKAYQTLYHPMDRGLYLLELYGKPLPEEESQIPTNFLEDIMEVNEKLSECTTAESIEAIRHVNDAKMEKLFNELSVSFKEKNFDRARELLGMLKYYVNIDNKIKELEDKFGIYRDD